MKLIIAVLLLTIGAFAQNTKYKDGTDCMCDSIVITYTASEAYVATGDTNITEDAVREIPFKNGTINGIWKRYYESGSIKSELPFINGKRNGIGKMYYESGALSLETLYKNDKTNGIEKSYYETGSVEVEYILSDTLIIGTSKWYREDGSLINEEHYNNKGKCDGINKWYFESGKLAGTATYKNGKLIGYKKCTDGRFGNESLDCLN